LRRKNSIGEGKPAHRHQPRGRHDEPRRFLHRGLRANFSGVSAPDYVVVTGPRLVHGALSIAEARELGAEAPEAA
jgi:hypothetical protein